MAYLMALIVFIALGTNIVGYAGLLLGGLTILYGIANGSHRFDCFRKQYRWVLLIGHILLHDIANNSLRVNYFRNLYRRVCTILSSIANSSSRADCFRNQYCQVRRVTARWAHDFVWYS